MSTEVDSTSKVRRKDGKDGWSEEGKTNHYVLLQKREAPWGSALRLDPRLTGLEQVCSTALESRDDGSGHRDLIAVSER
jgi:hypothetical protein